MVEVQVEHDVRGSQGRTSSGTGVVPATMRAAVVHAFDGDPASVHVDEVPVPDIGAGEVLVRMSVAPINPNDLMFLEDRYMVRRSAPTVVGFEGSGVVVRGAGMLGRALVGRRVACTASEHSGTWAEYCVSPASRCVPLRAGVSDAQGATLLTNPFTAWVLVDRCRREGHRALVQTAAAGALGQMVARLCLAQRFPAIHVVRRPQQVQQLKRMGAEHVLDSSAPGFDAELSHVAHELGATLCLDAVAGELAGRILAAMPPDSTLRVFGDLSGVAVPVDTFGVIFRRKRVEGFTMYDWVRETSLLEQARVALQVQRNLDGPLAVQIREELPLDRVTEALRSYRAAMSGGKVLLGCGAS